MTVALSQRNQRDNLHESIMDFDVLDSLDDLGYSVLTDDLKLKEAVNLGPKSIEFTQLIEWFSRELQALHGLDSCVNSITDPEDSSSFLLEVSSFLKELQCPYKDLVSGPISQRLLDVKSRTVLLDYLCTELQAARLLQHKTKKKNQMEIEVGDSNTAVSLNIVKNVLNIQTNEEESPSVLFSEIEEKINEHISLRPELISKAAVEEVLSEQQWESLDALYKDFLQDYSVRRELLLTRLDVTLQSFKWGERSEGMADKILNAYVHKRKILKKTPSVTLPDLIAARESILVIEKTSSADLVKNTTSYLNEFVIDKVPDRGGRPREQRPPVEMPNWGKRRAGGGGGRGDYRGGGNRQRGHRKHFKGSKDEDKSKGHFDAAGSY